MTVSVPTQCSLCGGPLSVERLRCGQCRTAIEGEFSSSWQGALSGAQSEFVRVFLECRGKIKDVEQALGVSYPTVVSRLDDIVQAITGKAPGRPTDRKAVLDALAAGEIDVSEATRRLKEIP